MMNKPIRVLVLGASGMLGNAVLRLFSESPGYLAFGSARSLETLRLFNITLHPNIFTGVEVDNVESFARLLEEVKPDVVINCIGLVKQLAVADDPLEAIPINAMLPHQLARMCGAVGARLIHMSTDCVYSGTKGMYTEDDISDARDMYGRSKSLGEVDYPNAITLRTSIIGHELNGTNSLVGWFLAQNGSVNGFRRAIFSGLPTVEIARLIRDHVIPHSELHGVYNVSAEPINKYDLLKLVAQEYGKTIEIKPDDHLVIDRSLDSTRFQLATGFQPKSWPELVKMMHEFG